MENQVQPAPAPATARPTGVRRWGVKLIGLLTALGVFGAIGGYYLPGLLDRLGSTVTDRAPFDIEFLGAHSQSPSYVFPATVRPDELPDGLLERRNLGQLRQWAADHGGVIAGRERIRFVLRGRTDAVVHIDEVRVNVVERRAPRCGWVNLWGPEGGSVRPRVMVVDTDTDAEARWFIDEEPAERPAFTVTASDEETFDVQLSASEREASWVIEVRYSSAERDGVAVIDDQGRPFVLTTSSRAMAYESLSGGPLVRAPARDGEGTGAPSQPC